MSQHFRFDASRSLTALEQDSKIVAVIEVSQTKWLVAALVPGVERQPLKKFDAQAEMLLKLLHRWRCEANQAGHNIAAPSPSFYHWRGWCTAGPSH
jgi:transposase